MCWKQNFSELYFHDVSSVTPSSGFSATLSPDTVASVPTHLIKPNHWTSLTTCFAMVNEIKLWKGCKNVKIALCVRVQRFRGARQITWRWSSSSIRNVTHIIISRWPPIWRGGGHSIKCYTGGSAPRSNPLSFYIPFLTEKGTCTRFACLLLYPSKAQV